MKISTHLHALVKSLNKAEKRRFALACGEDAHYARLFRAIAAQEVYDEEALKTAFAGEAQVRNFSVAKAYLEEKVLQVLRSPHKAISPEMMLRRALDNVEVLHGKGLFAHALQVLDAAIATADDYDLPAQACELLKWRRRLLNLLHPRGNHAALALVDEAERLALERLTQEAALRAIRAQVQSMALEQIDLRQAGNADRLRGLLAHPALQSPPEGLRFHARVAYHQVHATAARLLGDSDEGLRHLRLALHTWEGHPLQKSTYPDQHLNALAGFLDACLRAHRFDGFHDHLAQLHGMTLHDAALQAQAFTLGHHLELRYAISTADYQSGIRQAARIEEGLLRHSKLLRPGVALTFLYNLAVVHFLALEHSAALKYFNRILNQNHQQPRQDIFDAARVMEMAIHYALGNHDLLESLLRSMARRLRLHPRAYAFEKVVVSGLRRLMGAPRSQERGIFAEIHQQLDAVPGAAFLTGREEMLLWVSACMRGITPAEVALAKED